MRTSTEGTKDKQMALGGLVCNYLGNQAQRMVKLGPKAAVGDKKAVHDLRVAIRRSRTLIRLLQREFKGTGARAASRSLKELAAELGAVRDRDVFLEILGSLSKGAGAAALDEVRVHTESDRHEMLASLKEKLESADAKGAFEELGRVADRFKARSSDAVWAVFPRLAWRQLVEIRTLQSDLDRAEDKAIHRLRIEVKRLRYALEFLSTVEPQKIKPILEPLVRFQDAVGEMRDLTVAADRLDGLEEAKILRERAADRRREAIKLSGSALGVGFRMSLAQVIAEL